MFSIKSYVLLMFSMCLCGKSFAFVGFITNKDLHTMHRIIIVSDNNNGGGWWRWVVKNNNTYSSFKK